VRVVEDEHRCLAPELARERIDHGLEVWILFGEELDSAAPASIRSS
jgi:hypothetical protein